MKGFALRLALKQRHKGTRKWPIVYADKAKLQYLFPFSCHLETLQNMSYSKDYIVTFPA